MKKLIITIALLGVIYLLVNAQQDSIYAIYWNNTNSIAYIASFNFTKGTITTIASLPGVTGLTPGSSTFNNVNDQYIIKSNMGIIAIDVQTGAIADTFESVFNFSEFEFDSTTNMVYGVYWNDAYSTEYIASLDLTDGIITPIASLPGVTGLTPGSSTFNNVNDHYIIKSNMGITAINVQTGAIADTFESVFNFSEFEFDSTTNMVYGVYWNKTYSTEYLASLDLTDGKITAIASLPGVTTIKLGSSTLNYDGNQYIINSDLGIIAVDIQTGAIVDTFVTDLKISEFEYVKYKDTTVIHNSSSSNRTTYSFYVSPNPAINHTVIKGELQIKRVTIFNIMGQKVFENKFQNDKMVVLDTKLLNTGLYVILIETDSNTYINKLVINK
jgi:hypothetical protein